MLSLPFASVRLSENWFLTVFLLPGGGERGGFARGAAAPAAAAASESPAAAPAEKW